MDILEAVLDARPGAYARHDSLEELSEKLGLGRRNPRLGLLVANKALLEVCSPVPSLTSFRIVIRSTPCLGATKAVGVRGSEVLVEAGTPISLIN